MMSSDFYLAFEERFRGSRESVKTRLKVYLPFVYRVKEIYRDCPVLDVGCGRGEWLELLRVAGIDALGVDCDDSMVEICRKLSFSVEKAEAVSFIESLPAESKALITGFHFAEHIPFDDLHKFVQEALRALKPAGLLILETPNPDNLIVGSSKFYLDPTHRRPLPPRLLAFLTEYYGFYRNKIMYLQESPGLAKRDAINLSDLLYGTSQDYAIVAQKEASGLQIAAFDREFDTQHGLSFEQMVDRYDVQSANYHLRMRGSISWLIGKLVLRLKEKVRKLLD